MGANLDPRSRLYGNDAGDDWNCEGDESPPAMAPAHQSPRASPASSPRATTSSSSSSSAAAGAGAGWLENSKLEVASLVNFVGSFRPCGGDATGATTEDILCHWAPPTDFRKRGRQEAQARDTPGAVSQLLQQLCCDFTLYKEKELKNDGGVAYRYKVL